MIDPSNRVFTNVMLYVQHAYDGTLNIHFQNSNTVTPEKLPSVSVVQQDCYEADVDLSPGDPDVDYSVRSTVQIDTYSSKSPTEAKEIMDAACKAMRGMAYSRINGPYDLTAKTRPNYYRYVARFARVVSTLDEIPRYNFDPDTPDTPDTPDDNDNDNGGN